MTIVEALKRLVLAFGGTASTGKTVVDVLKDVNTAIGGTTDAKTASEAIDAVAESVEDNVVVPEGKKTITSTAEVDVKAYATAQVVDANLIAGNIKKDVSVLGITGEYEGSGGSSDFSTATVVVDNQNGNNDVMVNMPCVLEANAMGEGTPACVYDTVYCEAGATFTATVPLYKGSCIAYSMDVSSYTGDISTLDTGTYVITGDGTLVMRGSF